MNFVLYFLFITILNLFAIVLQNFTFKISYYALNHFKDFYFILVHREQNYN